MSVGQENSTVKHKPYSCLRRKLRIKKKKRKMSLEFHPKEKGWRKCWKCTDVNVQCKGFIVLCTLKEISWRSTHPILNE